MIRRPALALISAVLATAAVVAPTAVSAAQASTFGGFRPWPQQVYAPYFETFLPGSIPVVATQSHARFQSLAFLQTASAGSCTLTWDGDSTQPVGNSPYESEVAQLQAAGGNVIPSFGGFTADTTNTEIADSCTSVPQIAADYEQVITTYHATRLDMDIEADSLNNTAAIDRRNKALTITEAWAAQHRIPLQIQYTLPVATTGFLANSLALLQNAVDNGTRVDVVNPLAFDYFLASEPQPLDMAGLAIGDLQAVHTQLAAIYPKLSSSRLWRKLGVTLMAGIDDFPGKTEVTSLADARKVLGFAAIHHLALFSLWATQRDNGTCVGTAGANACSGISQPQWGFSHVLEPFTSPGAVFGF